MYNKIKALPMAYKPLVIYCLFEFIFLSMAHRVPDTLVCLMFLETVRQVLISGPVPSLLDFLCVRNVRKFSA
jgi:hypothetical protein